MITYFEIKITDANDNVYYEIATSTSECFMLMKLHNGVKLEGVE